MKVFLAFCSIVKLQKRKSKLSTSSTTAEKKYNCLRGAATLYNLGIFAVLLANTRKSLKFYRFESEQNLVSFIDLNFFFRLFLVYFAAETGIVFNLFVNFEQK